jgi:hypothetical protein
MVEKIPSTTALIDLHAPGSGEFTADNLKNRDGQPQLWVNGSNVCAVSTMAFALGNPERG